ncbi:MAG TPA: CBS domain-containing protein [Xanthobacteraceae bacterium]|nr:CBS domain-containing protein [Xanthobacteraceae bacterium]
MTVKALLARKGSHVTTIGPTVPLTAAIKMLSDHRIGALVVTGAEGRVIGIISERDIVRALAEHAAQALEHPVSEVMTRNVVTCSECDTVCDLMERMTDGKFRHIPVIEQGRLCGIVSIGDVVKRRVEELEHDGAALQDYIRTA